MMHIARQAHDTRCDITQTRCPSVISYGDVVGISARGRKSWYTHVENKEVANAESVNTSDGI